MNFKPFKQAAAAHFAVMVNQPVLFRSSVDPDSVWATYLAAFTPEQNPIFRERTKHDCSCCRNYIKRASQMVALVDGKIVTAWDFDAGEYQHVTDAMSALIRQAPIANVFIDSHPTLGLDRNTELLESGGAHVWEHFYGVLPAKFIAQGDLRGTKESQYRASYDVFKRSLTELSMGAVDTVIELIAQNSLYRGTEFLPAVKEFRKAQRIASDTTSEELDLFCWQHAATGSQAVSRFRNTAIGTLVTDLSEGVDLDAAVRSFETKVAPTNYKRTTALVTQGMIEEAKKKVIDLGIESALARRHATYHDLSVNDVLFIDRNKTVIQDSVFDVLTPQTTTKSFDKAEEIGIEDFLSKVLPTCSSLELLVQPRMHTNTVSIVAPANVDAPHLFKWDNGFSWAYNGDVTDSIKEKVKKAGGVVDAVMRCSLAWHNHDDLDLHCETPSGRIYFLNKQVKNGKLDVDMNAGRGTTREPVENIFWNSTPEPGVYTFKVNNFQLRENTNAGFEIELEFNGQTMQMSSEKSPGTSRSLEVVTLVVARNGEISAEPKLQSVSTLSTQGEFKQVNAVISSPNHWGNNHAGNKHTFFIINDMRVDDDVRGFFNEYLRDDLQPHRKVFEILGAQTKVPPAENQLCGYGFSETVRNQVIVKATGTFTRILKINF